MTNIKQQLFIIILLTQILFSATPEQIERYISISNSEEQLITLESQFSQMQNNINSISKEESSNYDMQFLSIRFREYLQKNISENEMDEIMKQYTDREYKYSDPSVKEVMVFKVNIQKLEGRAYGY